MWIKICGIRDVNTALQIAELAPNAIGLNFYANSPRRITPETAREITREMSEEIEAVGVFVDHGIDEIVQLARDCWLSMVQLHGNESPEFVAALQERLGGRPILRAWRMAHDLQDLSDYLADCEQRNVLLEGCLIDAKVSGSYGGTGHSPPWNTLRTAYRRADWPSLILAGGLTPDNVTGAIAVVQPWGVDVASGVESSPGIKDLPKVAQFIQEVRRTET